MKNKLIVCVPFCVFIFCTLTLGSILTELAIFDGIVEFMPFYQDYIDYGVDFPRAARDFLCYQLVTLTVCSLWMSILLISYLRDEKRIIVAFYTSTVICLAFCLNGAHEHDGYLLSSLIWDCTLGGFIFFVLSPVVFAIEEEWLVNLTCMLTIVFFLCAVMNIFFNAREEYIFLMKLKNSLVFLFNCAISAILYLCNRYARNNIN